MTASFPRKKPRGWKRRMRELDRWAAGSAALSPDEVRSDYQSVEVWFERWPWPFPVGVRRRMVQHLVDVHDRWHAQLKTWGEPYYLGIWLFEPEFKGSQVCATAGWRAAEYLQRHDPARRSPPPRLYDGHPRDLRRFEWTSWVHTERERLSGYDRADWPLLLRRARSVERTGDDVELTFEHRAWYGRLADGA